jgi:predicted nucleic acid-binding protein
MPEAPRYIYWDSSCFVSLISGEPDRLPVLAAIMDQAAKSKGQLFIITSMISVTEVAYSVQEHHGRQLDQDVEDRIDGLWRDENVLRLVEFHELIAREARALIRGGVPQGWSGLRGADAIHLATAKFMQAVECHTYEQRVWHRYADVIGCPVLEPRALKPFLPGLESP